MKSPEELNDTEGWRVCFCCGIPYFGKHYNCPHIGQKQCEPMIGFRDAMQSIMKVVDS